MIIMNIQTIEIPKGKNNRSNGIIPILYEYKDKIGKMANRKGWMKLFKVNLFN